MTAAVASSSSTHGLSRLTIACAALAYTAFAIYGSWVPLKFKPIPLDQAVARFQQIEWLTLGVGHRADWVANILLFIPLTFSWMGALWPRHWIPRLLASVVVWTLAAALAVAIEFSQVFFPGRTTSLNDIAAEIIGGGIGVCAWWLAGERLSRWLADVRRESRPLGAIERLLVAYVAIVVLYALLPFDLTLSATEVVWKWRRGAIILTPFTFREAHAADSVYSMLSEVLIWIPMGVFVVRRWSLDAWRAVLAVAAGALVVELLQVFVYSRTSDVNDVIAASAGAAIGAVAARRLGLAVGAAPRQALPSGLLTTLGLLIAWAVGAAFVFLFPFDFNLSGEFIRPRLDGVPRVLFASYYWGSEYNAVTQVMRKMLYFLPLGAVLAWGFVDLRSAVLRAVYGVVAAGLVVGAAVAVEIAQLALPGKIVDPTDAMLASIGALAGWMLVTWVVRLRSHSRADAIVSSRDC